MGEDTVPWLLSPALWGRGCLGPRVSYRWWANGCHFYQSPPWWVFPSVDCPTPLSPFHSHPPPLPAATLPAALGSIPFCSSPKNGPNHLYPPPPQNRFPLQSTPPSTQQSESSWSDSNLTMSVFSEPLHGSPSPWGKSSESSPGWSPQPPLLLQAYIHYCHTEKC